MNAISKISCLISIALLIGCADKDLNPQQQISSVDGLVAFWDFENGDEEAYRSRFDEKTGEKSYPVYLRQIGDPQRYSAKSWPYEGENSALMIDETGPFSHAVRFNQGYIYGEIPRSDFDATALDLSGRNPFTMVAWVKFNGNRHMVAGIWDEGGWNRYAGRRQAALFAGLFNQKGVIAHISSTGAASFPQSEVDGSQYARLRAIDGAAFENGEWVMIAMSYDPEKGEVRAYLDGRLTEGRVIDPVIEDVLQNAEIPLSNPLSFKASIYSPMSFQIKYNGYDFKAGPIKEHLLWVDLNDHKITYNQNGSNNETRFKIVFDVTRSGQSILKNSIDQEIVSGDLIDIPWTKDMTEGDVITSTLEQFENGEWQQIGTAIEKTISAGAPFTFGRALGLDEDGLEHGSSALYIDWRRRI